MTKRKSIMLAVFVCVSCAVALGADAPITSSASPAPPAPSLAGFVYGPAGEPLADAVVTAWNGQAFEARTGADGRYEFAALPEGPFALLCAAPPTPDCATRIIRVPQVYILRDAMLGQDFSFSRAFTISGRVLYDDLSPAAGRIVSARFMVPEGDTEFVTAVSAGAQGEYRISSPFPRAAYLGMIDDTGNAMVRRELDAAKGLENIDFVMRTGSAYEGLTAELTMVRDAYEAEESPPAEVIVTNNGARNYFVGAAQELWQVEIDGVRYLWTGPVDVKAASMGPGKSMTVKFTLGKEWAPMRGNAGEPLTLTPGRHSLRVVTGADADGKGLPAMIQSNRVWFEVLPAK